MPEDKRDERLTETRLQRLDKSQHESGVQRNGFESAGDLEVSEADHAFLVDALDVVSGLRVMNHGTKTISKKSFMHQARFVMAHLMTQPNYLDELSVIDETAFFDLLHERVAIAVVGDSEPQKVGALGDLDFLDHSFAVREQKVVETNLTAQQLIRVQLMAV